MPPNSSPTFTIPVRYAAYAPSSAPNHSKNNPLDGSLGLFLAMFLFVLLLIVATCIILYRIHLRSPAKQGQKIPATPGLKQLFLVQSPTTASLPEQEPKPTLHGLGITQATPPSSPVKLSRRFANFISKCKPGNNKSSGSSTRTVPTEVPAIVVSTCSPLSETATRSFGPNHTSRSSSSDSLQVPGGGGGKRNVLPRSNQSPLRVLSNMSGRPFELKAPPSSHRADTGEVGRISLKRPPKHVRQQSISFAGKENAFPGPSVGNNSKTSSVRPLTSSNSFRL